ncbi:MAG: J domain-containing protein [Acidobacteria bacterium]|nr:J domain-containing protein [Acidobacteriota bacterium]
MDLYVVLGLAHGASELDIKRAYRRLARRYHPDINPGDRTAAARFRQIVEAYETLVDPQRRSRYDSGLDVEDGGGRRASGFEGFDFSMRGVDHSATFGDLFADVLAAHGARRPSPERGADLHQTIALGFDEAFAGVVRGVTVTRRETCRACAGSGRTRGSPGPCPSCEGSGSVRSVRGHMVFARSCAACGGTGHQRPHACERCGGAGQQTRSETVQVRIPPGIGDGDRVRVPGTGNAGLHGAPAGDLYIAVHVAAHPVFRRAGDDVHMVLPIAIHEAALGTRIDVPAPDGGVARLRVPPGTQSGQRFRLRERGAASARDGRRGDLVVEVRLMLPTVLDERSKELLREFGRINGESVRAPGRGDTE